MIVTNNKYLIDYKILIPVLIFPDLLFKLFISGQGRMSIVSMVYICIFVYFLQYRKFQKIVFSGPMMIWLTLTIYHCINASLKHVPGFGYPEYLRGLRVYSSLCIFTFLFSINAKTVIKYTYYSLAIWLFIALVDTGYTPGERLSGENVIAVAFGKNSALMAIMGIYLSVLAREPIKTLALRLIYPILFVFLAQGRNAFGMIVVQLVGYYYSFVMKSKITLKRGVVALSLTFFSVLAVYTIMNNSALGERFMSDFDSVEEAAWRQQYMTGTFFDYIAGERISYYTIGWFIFTNHPITGIGLDDYIHFTQGEFPMHIEYMVHLAEGGIIAAVLWLSFIISLFIVILRSTVSRQMKSMALFTMAAILFTCAFSVMFKNELVVMLFGLILSIQYPSKHSVFYQDKIRNVITNK